MISSRLIVSPVALQDLYESLSHIWDEMVRAEVKVWSKFNSYWLKKALPVVAIRYEDLILYPEVRRDTEILLIRYHSYLCNQYGEHTM